MIPTVIKKDETVVSWDFNKISTAVNKSASRLMINLTKKQLSQLESIITDKVSGMESITIQQIHGIVEDSLITINPNIANSYQTYRNYKQEFTKSFDKIFMDSLKTLYVGDRENANFDSSLISTKGSLIRGFLTKELFRKFHLSKEELEAIDEGYIYIHDLKDMIFNSINCCLMDIKTVLSNGFTMNPISYSEPKAVLAAIQVIGDMMLGTTAQQFGGFTIPDIDKILVPYVKRSYEFYKKEAYRYNIQNETYAQDKVYQELRQGFQAIEHKLNSIPSSRGDFAFTTFSFGNMDNHDPEFSKIQHEICTAILDVRMRGDGKGQPVTFPKLVFLFNNGIYNGTNKEFDKGHINNYRDLFDMSIRCSSKCMYPDYLAIDSDHGDVSRIYRKHKEVVHPMGCRAYLSEFLDDNGKAVFTGRANIGAVALNLPMIWMKAKEENKQFFDVLSVYMEMIREFHKKRYVQIAESLASTNPIAFTQGGLYKGNKAPDEKIGYDTVKSFTASFGITALNELSVLSTGKMLHEDDGNEFINEVVDFINNKINEFKHIDGWLYALYGVPAESLCGTQVNQFRHKYGIVEGVSDRDYFSNSFHCHVTADITPFEKQDKEFKLFHKVNGGHIQYTRFSNNRNIIAITSTVLRGMELGFYSGVNFDLVICEDCGHRPKNDVDICPKCKSTNILMINRLCGYIGYGKKGGSTRFNDAKLSEVKERVSM